MQSVRVIFALATAVLLTGVFADQAQATKGTLKITKDTTLKEKHRGRIVIAADDVTLDCRKYAVIGRGGGIGILLKGKTGSPSRTARSEISRSVSS